MSATIAEMAVLDVACLECGWGTGPFTARSEAEEAATDHDMEWHAPILDDEAVPA